MSKVDRELVEKAGIDVDLLIEKLKKAAAIPAKGLIPRSSGT